MPDVVAIDPVFLLGNRIEAGLWAGMAILLAARLTLRHDWSMVRSIGIATLVLFGISDLVECTTGAWWRPWWLLAWKTAGVLGLVGWAWTEWRGRRRGRSGQPAASPALQQ